MFKKYNYKIYVIAFCLLFVIIVYNIVFKKNNLCECYITDKLRDDLTFMKYNECVLKLNKAGAMEGELNYKVIESNCRNIVNIIPEDTLLKKYNEFLKNL